jgi:hypothetical protein
MPARFADRALGHEISLMAALPIDAKARRRRIGQAGTSIPARREPKLCRHDFPSRSRCSSCIPDGTAILAPARDACFDLRSRILHGIRAGRLGAGNLPGR